MSCSECQRELRRRRHRRKKVEMFVHKLRKATVSERGVIAKKLLCADARLRGNHRPPGTRKAIAVFDVCTANKPRPRASPQRASRLWLEMGKIRRLAGLVPGRHQSSRVWG